MTIESLTEEANRIYTFTNTVVIAILVFAFALMFTTDTDRAYGNGATDLSLNWTDDRGNPAELDKIGSGISSYVQEIPAALLDGRELCFRSKNVNIYVYQDGKKVYSYEPRVFRLFGKSYGLMYHCVNLEAAENNSVIMIETENVYNDSKAYLAYVRLQESDRFIFEMLQNDMPRFLISLLLLLVGIVLTISSIAVRKSPSSRLELLAMGVFTLTVSTWTITETLVLQLLTRNPAAVHFIGYICTMIMPLPALAFVTCITKRLEQMPVKIIVAVSLVNTLINMISTSIGFRDYHELLILTHILILISLVVSIVYIVDSIIQKQMYEKASVTMAIACFFMFGGALADILRYRIGANSTDIAMWTRYGLMAFMLVMGGYEIYSIMQYAHFEDEAEAMTRLAHTDSMTQMKNRTAYGEKTAALKSADTGSGCFVLLDINNLKTVNDVYGHEEGDKHIKKGAECIRRSFGMFGECYRIGGDEFFVVVEEPASEEKCRRAGERLMELVSDYNRIDRHPVPLDIAFGSARYDCAQGNVREAYHQADEKMYELKKAMKEAVRHG